MTARTDEKTEEHTLLRLFCGFFKKCFAFFGYMWENKPRVIVCSRAAGKRQANYLTN